MAGAGRPFPTRNSAGALLVRGSTLFGSATPTSSIGAMSCASVHVRPRSVDFWNAALSPCAPLGFPPALLPVLKIWLKKLYSVPVRGSTAMMLPIVWFLFIDGWALVLMTLTGDQVAPKSVVRVN